MKRTTSQNAVVSTAIKKSSHANAPDLTASQCRQRSTASTAAGLVISADKANVRRRLFNGKCMDCVVIGMAMASSLLAQSHASTVVAIALNALAIVWLLVRWRQCSFGNKNSL